MIRTPLLAMAAAFGLGTAPSLAQTIAAPASDFSEVEGYTFRNIKNTAPAKNTITVTFKDISGEEVTFGFTHTVPLGGGRESIWKVDFTPTSWGWRLGGGAGLRTYSGPFSFEVVAGLEVSHDSYGNIMEATIQPGMAWKLGAFDLSTGFNAFYDLDLELQRMDGFVRVSYAPKDDFVAFGAVAFPLSGGPATLSAGVRLALPAATGAAAP